jgi:hypothetical protein
MFQNDILENELKYSHTLQNNQKIWVEWNLNQSENISRVGNYRYRPATNDTNLNVIRPSYDPNEVLPYYTGATDSDIVINAGFDDSDNPSYLISPKKKINLLYSLEDCFKQNRPRSGINKLLYLGKSQYIDSINVFRETKSATITNAASIEGYITFTAINNFLVGDYVKITGIAPSSYDQVNPVKIVAVTDTSFSILGNNANAYQNGGLAEIGYLGTNNVARRPRYYMASRYDDFKYWTSYRKEVERSFVDGKEVFTNNEFGISLNRNTGTSNKSYYIYDAAPFVVYNEKIPTNKIVIKMQTNVGEINNGPYRFGARSASAQDPFYGEKNKTVPKKWQIQTLNESNQWQTIISFGEDSVRDDGSAIIGSDGQVEVEYGLTIPWQYYNYFTLVGEITSLSQRPEYAPYGYAYLYKQSSDDKGVLYVYDGGTWDAITPEYTWRIAELDVTSNRSVIKKLSNPDYYVENSIKHFREFEFIKGIRVVVDTMNKVDCTFDLIEMSPRLIGDITKKVVSFSVKKTLADLANYSMPMGNLIASTGSLSIFDDDLSFNDNNIFDDETNVGSIISKYSNTRIKFLFYDVTTIKEIEDGVEYFLDYYIPIKTLYSEKIPQVSDTAASISLELRDLFFFFESKKSPELLLTNVSLSYAITVLLDNIGFSNYVFKRTEEDNELIIPFFFVGPNQNIAETLQQLAISSQSAMFFDEYNNLIVMSKNYILPSEEARPTDLTLYGQETSVGDKIALPNILNVASEDKLVYNGGEINYTTRYIQKSIGSIAQAPYIDEYKTYIYKPVLLWEVAGQEKVKTVNESATRSSGYSLSAMPLKTTLSAITPSIVNGNLINNIIDFGESVYWLGNYSGYFYANSEIIRYDAVEYSIAGVGNIWINNNQQYQKYFSKLKFNGKMYPTGRVRIYTDVQGTTVKEHGRGQFSTNIVEHQAGIGVDSSWVSPDNLRGSIQNAQEYLFNTNKIIAYNDENLVHTMGSLSLNIGTPEQQYADSPYSAGNIRSINGQRYTALSYAKKSSRNGIIKNFMANTNITENDVNYYKSALSGSVQSSALIFDGPDLPSEIDPANFISYTYKQLDKPYKHFGTRMRVIGEVQSKNNSGQTPQGAFNPYPSNQIISSDPNKQTFISGGSGGMAFNLNKDTNIGYYYEIMALSENNITNFKNNSNADSYSIAKVANGISCTADTVTVTLTSQHDFEIGTQISVTGAIDDSRKTAPATSLNGQFTVTEIDNTRKKFKFKMAGISSSANITDFYRTAQGSFWKITYIADNSFKAGQLVSISGLSPSAYNIPSATIFSANEKQFTVQVSSDFGTPSDKVGTATYIANITDISRTGQGNAWTITYVSNNRFRAGQLVSISGLSPSAYNISNAIISSANEKQFTIQATSDPGSPSDKIGTATYVALTTNSASGGIVSKSLDEDTQISNIFFYKVNFGFNKSEIIKKYSHNVTEVVNGSPVTYNLATLTTLRNHYFSAGEKIIVNGVGSDFNGLQDIFATTSNTISYKINSSNQVSETEVSPVGNVTGIDAIAIPQILWRGLTDIIVDDGKFTGQSRMVAGTGQTVYDLSAEYVNIASKRRFYLYLNDKQVAVVDDPEPLPEYSNIALFVRGSSRCMFENVYALSDNFAENVAKGVQLPVSQNNISAENEVIRNYALNGIIQSTYLKGISSESDPQYALYYDEFGTIMREAAYFNIRYDRAYPALYAKIADVLNNVKAYTVSGFLAGSYGAEFLIFNIADKNINLDDTSGNYLRILGIAFTQNTTHSLKVDDFFRKNSNFTNAIYSGSNNAEEYQKLYNDVLNSRNKYGRNDFSIEAEYVQTDDAAESMMDWIIKKVITPRKTVGVSAFGVPHLQLGDIVNINYKSSDVDIVANSSTRFAVYNIEHQKSSGSIQTTLYLAEV